jgi:putative oxidoreductase
MISDKQYSFLLLLIRIILGIVFIYAGFKKVSDPLAFSDSIESYQLIPYSWIILLALSLPIFEILIGSLLILGVGKGGPSFGVIILTSVFILALTQALLRGLEVDCGCFGGGGKPTLLKSLLEIGRDLLILSGAFLCYKNSFQRSGN